MSKVKALSLFSGGLDSILATRVVMDQGIEVTAVKFVSPFFDYEILSHIEGYCQEVKDKYGINVVVVDISKGYLEMLRNPAYGYGKNFNPCVDCKIFMVNRAKKMLAEYGASFLITGEVIGQRPMSQRRDTLNVISRDSESRSVLLRPLCAKLMSPTQPEEDGLVDREKLLNFSGRGRSRQIALAAEYGITDFPSPAGGCVLADPILSRRIENFYGDNFVVKYEDMTVTDVLLLLVGRQFLLPNGGWLMLGRDERDNDKLESICEEGDALLGMEERPGPIALLRRASTCYADDAAQQGDLNYAAGLVVRYGKKVKDGPQTGEVICTLSGEKKTIIAEPLADEISREWML
ncbi:thiamine biosynthesis protein [Desulfosediminicola flagellatus]|uniref:thiamine biosynthesis protein n=1 Tax=Desulfosediminicola flagellatus TaxID=2569541 RepID=UPI0010AB9D67|nr:thiamine biosynthesis protein [Desulfosediminicola flagellatus]